MLESKRIILRALEPSDADLLYKWENNTQIWHVSNTQMPYSKDYLIKYINAVSDIYTDKQLRLVIIDKANNVALGFVDLFDVDFNHQRAGVGILVADEKTRRNGFANESIKLIIDYAFTVLNLQQLFCNILKSNQPSISLFLKNKFTHAGCKKKWIRTASGFEDELMLQLIKE
jgi:diamine N-acetyltransferase